MKLRSNDNYYITFVSGISFVWLGFYDRACRNNSAVKSQEDTDRKKTYNKNTYKKHFINMKPHCLSKKLEKKKMRVRKLKSFKY